MSHTISEIAIQVLDIAKKRSQSAEVIHIRNEDTQVEFKSDELKVMYTRYTDGIGLRVIKDGKLGFSCTTDISHLNLLVERAYNSAQFGQEAKFHFPASLPHDTGKKHHLEIYDLKVAQYSVDSMVKTGQHLVEFVKLAEPEVKCDAEIAKRTATVDLLNTTGNHIHYQKTMYTEMINALKVEPEGFLWVDEYVTSGKLTHLSDELLTRLIDKIKEAKKPASVSTKPMPVIFVPKVLYAILGGFELGCNGKYIQKGTSPLTGKLGQQLVSSELTIIDDPTIPYGVNSTPFDDEGVVHRPLTLIDKGKLNHYIYDLQTAGLMHTHSTGHGHRGYNSLPVPDYTNFIIQPGNIPYQKMIGQVKEGIIVHQVLGSGQSNILAGDFSLNVDLGFKIENGQVVGRVKDTMVSGNIFTAFKNIQSLSQEVETSGNLTAPWILLDQINVTSAVES
jgi:PmbA protein